MQNKENAGLSRKQIFGVIGIMTGIIVILLIMLGVMIAALTSRDEAGSEALESVKQYSYGKLSAENGMVLHLLMTKPSNVTLEAIHNNVTLTDRVGINGGFFYGDQLLSLGVVNGLPVNGAANAYGSGDVNAKYSRGTLVWDGASDSLSVQIISKASEVKVKDHSRFWAQGGISMNLNNDENWVAQAVAEHAPFMDDERLRTAAVYDDQGFIYLIVSETKGTLAAFREAIVSTVGNGRLVDGVFLDGDGSSQLLSKEAALAGDNRPVVQMLRIVK